MLNKIICHEHAADGGSGGGQCDVNIPSLSRSKAVANDYRHSTGVDFEPNEHAADGVTAGQARHNSSNVGGVTAGHVGHNSSSDNNNNGIIILIIRIVIKTAS